MSACCVCSRDEIAMKCTQPLFSPVSVEASQVTGLIRFLSYPTKVALVVGTILVFILIFAIWEQVNVKCSFAH